MLNTNLRPLCDLLLGVVVPAPLVAQEGPVTNASWYTSNPLHGIYAAVTRQTIDGAPEGGRFPRERTNVKGKIQPGFLADIAVFERPRT